MESESSESNKIDVNNASDNKKKPKTAAQRNKEYRQRLREKNNQSVKQQPKTLAQRSKDFRQRKKKEEESIEILTEKQEILIKTGPKSDAQRNREYRQRQKEKQFKSIEVPTDKKEILIKTASKSGAQRNREYRQRQKEKNCISDTLQKNTKTKADINKDYNDKLRKQKEISQLHEFTLTPNDFNSPMKKKNKVETSHKELTKKKLFMPKNEIEINTTQQSLGLRENIEQYDSDLARNIAQYEQHESCATPDVILHHTPENIAGEDRVIDNTNKTQMIQDVDVELSDAETDGSENENFVINNNIESNENYSFISELGQGRVTIPIYTNYYDHTSGHLHYYKNFTKNSFGYSCAVCDRLWWKNDLKKTSDKHEDILNIIIPNFVSGNKIDVCSTCKKSLDNNKIPLLSVYNGFSYPTIPSHLPKLNLIEERLISPRIPFMQIRRLRHVHGQYGIYGQIINVPLEVNTMVNQLPRNIEDDHSFYVHIKKKLTHKTSYVHGLISKKNIKEWLTYLVTTPLYLFHDIKIDNNFLQNNDIVTDLVMDEISEHIPIEDNMTAQQQTLMWNEDKYLHMAPGEKSSPLSLLFDEYAEELSFPTIYGGQFRNYREEIQVTPFMQATSELRRTDRRATDPQHLLYMATKIMRLRVSKSVSIAFKHVGHDTKISKEDVQSENYINNCIENNLAFLRCIPNSVWYWADRKRDLFAMIRQLGAPTAFMTLSANESGWQDLIKLLYKLKNKEDASDEFLSNMTYVQQAKLINEDAVTCAIYFNKLVNCFMKILQAKKRSPFGKYRVINYFLRIEFQHRGSPHAHILLWLDNAPKDLLNNNDDVVEMIDKLVSVSESEASGNIKLQTHKHTFTCSKKTNEKDNCRFGAPFMPTKKTITLFPMKKDDPEYSEDMFKKYKEHYKSIRSNLDNVDYNNFDHFYAHNNIEGDEHYYKIISAGIKRPKLFYRRQPSEKWYNSFNPFVLHHLKANMDFQIIQDEFACAAYVVEYVNKHNRGISNLQQQILKIMEENPEFDIGDITKKMSVDVLHSVEMPAQEAAWYLLRKPMAKSSIITAYIPTIWPTERQRIRKTLKELNELNDDCTDVWKENCFDKYEKRPDVMNDVTLAQFVANYYLNNKKVYTKRETPKIIRYRNYDIADNFNDYRREMVLLHIPFRSEDNDILAENKFIQIYEDNKDIILQRRKEFESNLDIEKTLQICRELCRENDEDENEQLHANFMFEADPYERMGRDPDSNVNADIQQALLGKLGSIAKKRENIMDRSVFCELMRSANKEQQDLLMNIISHLHNANEDKELFKNFLTGPAGSGKTFVIKLIMEIYNRFSNTDGCCNAYVTCASTGKAAVAIDGTTVHTALKISIAKLLPLSNEMRKLYMSLFNLL